jgi:hypothetical protein
MNSEIITIRPWKHLFYTAGTQVGLDNTASGVILTFPRYKTFYTAIYYIRNNGRKSYHRITVQYDMQPSYTGASYQGRVHSCVYNKSHIMKPVSKYIQFWILELSRCSFTVDTNLLLTELLNSKFIILHTAMYLLMASTTTQSCGYKPVFLAFKDFK